MIVAKRPDALAQVPTHYCPGCTHGIIHRLVAEAIDALGVEGRAVGIAPVGCSVLAYNYFNCDMIVAAHGRAPAVATGLKRANPESVVFSYQGDGDLASIGMAEIVHAAARGENITVIFVNNAVYGMTGGQMAPTTLPGMRTTTSPYGRDTSLCGHPIRMCEMLDTLVEPLLIARSALTSPKHIIKAKKLIKQAFELQQQGFTFVELLSTCPTGWGLTPENANLWLERNMIPYFPLKTFREPGNMPEAARKYTPDLKVKDDKPKES